MKWDIDKALEALEDSGIAGTTFTRAMVETEALIQEKLGHVTAAERAKGYAKVWCLGLGKMNERKLFIYGRTIRSACLRARIIVRQLTPEELRFFGLRAPKKRRKSPHEAGGSR